MFDIGQEVICVDASGTSVVVGDGVFFPISHELVKGAHYHIRWIGMYKHPLLSEMLCVRLEEVRRPFDAENPLDSDMPYRATRFVPVKKVSTDISALKSLLNTKEKVLEDVC